MGETVKISRGERANIKLKTSISVWVLYSHESFKSHMITELSKSQSITFETIALNDVNSESLKNLSQPDLIFVDTGPNWAQKIVELQNYGSLNLQDNIHTSLIVCGDESDNGALKIALRIGAADYVSEQVRLEDLVAVLKNAAEEKVSSRNLGELFVFLNTKGGSGATTVVLNTAAQIAHENPGKVLLLDLDIHFGVVMDYLDLTPVYSINDAVDNVTDLDEVSLGGLVTKHSSGLHILSFKHDNNNENHDKAKQLGLLLPILREFYPYVLVDLSMGIDHLFSPALSHASKALLITQQNLIGIKNSSRMCRSLISEYGLAKDQIEVVVNRYEKRQQIKLKDVEESIPGALVHTIPNDFKVAIESVNLGKPFVQSKVNSSISKAVVELAHSLSPQKETNKSWIKRLFS